uniref:Zinc metalloproteinase n=1 Tax=Parastrongyloides trichosuri TaxID=131310 RepID=A0A0N4ZLA3_PARTI
MKTIIHILILILTITNVFEAITREELQKETRKSLNKDSKDIFDNHIKSMSELNKLNDKLHNRTNVKDDKNKEANESLMENSELYQGDMILTPNHAHVIIEEAKLKVEAKKHGNSSYKDMIEKMKKLKVFKKNMQLKWDFPIPYYIDYGVNPSHVLAALKDIEDNTCIRFKRYGRLYGMAGLRYYQGRGCNSVVGRAGKDKVQDISIGRGCEMMGIIQHETLHALGFFHEQSRPDRNQYLTILLNNVAPNMRNNYEIFNTDQSDTFGIPYNYGSAMQYDKKAFSYNGRETMIPKNPLYLNTIGNKARLQFLDFKMVNRAYCSEKCKSSIKCENGGYEDPNKCGICKCPYTLGGRTCTEYLKNPPSCGAKNTYTLEGEPVTIKAQGKVDCVYYIKSNRKVRLIMGDSNLASRGEACYSGDALEVQYLNDKSLTGVMYCGKVNGKTITSEGSLMIVKYTGTVNFNYVVLKFESV